jgi:hypothetical protein
MQDATITERGQMSIPAELHREMKLAPVQTVLWEKFSATECRLVIEPRKVTKPDPVGAIGFAKRTVCPCAPPPHWRSHLDIGAGPRRSRGFESPALWTLGEDAQTAHDLWTAHIRKKHEGHAARRPVAEVLIDRSLRPALSRAHCEKYQAFRDRRVQHPHQSRYQERDCFRIFQIQCIVKSNEAVEINNYRPGPDYDPGRHTKGSQAQTAATAHLRNLSGRRPAPPRN